MLTVELPVIPRVSLLNGTTFQSVVFCRFVSLSGPKRKLSQSQRQILSLFNRSSPRSVSRYFAEAQKKGLIRLIHRTTGADPNVYIRGEFFATQSEEARAIVTMSNSLWGTNGILRTWPFPTAWGHGCIPPAVILSLATLRVLDESISKNSLKRYLSPLVPESSFNSAMKFLVQHHLAYGESGRLIIASDWEPKLSALLEANPACNKRQQRNDKKWKQQSEINRSRVQQGKLTSADLGHLLALPCVVKGCRSKRHQQEHFPPKKYLKQHFRTITSRHLVWSICKRHNAAMKGFIARMPKTIQVEPRFLWVHPNADPLRIYGASANKWILEFHQAYLSDDTERATRAVVITIGLMKAVEMLPTTTCISQHEPGRIKRKRVGKYSYSPDRSQLPHRIDIPL